MDERIKKIPERNGSVAEHSLAFQVQLPALGYSTYSIVPGTARKVNQVLHLKKKTDVTMSNKVKPLQYTPEVSDDDVITGV